MRTSAQLSPATNTWSSMLATIALWAGISIAALILLANTLRTVPQASVAVVTLFGKYRRVLRPGLNMLIPFFERIAISVPVQNRTSQLQFSAITKDQAAVHFTATIIYGVSNHDEETVKLVAFSFINAESFQVALRSAVEASVREFVATKAQSEVLGLRQTIVAHAKETLDVQVASWGYTISDLQINDVQFDEEITKSMSRVVSALNAKKSAEYEGEALLITRTKAAEAEGAAIRISAENEATASRLRGEGQAAFRKAVAQGLSESAAVLEGQGLGEGMLAYTMWTETLREVAKEGKGNTIFLDGNLTTMEQSMHRLSAITAASGKPKDADVHGIHAA
jgi:regulator of protease activity HflC (stomatin/prohibitin superfamily)